jgi:uncharacterized protein
MIGNILEGIGFFLSADHSPSQQNSIYSETAGQEAISKFLKEQNYPQEKIELVLRIVKGIGFKNELAGGLEVFPELAIVQVVLNTKFSLQRFIPL